MSEEKELKLACLHQAGGDLDHAKALFDWVSGSVRATPDSEAAEVSAPKQDKPQQSFNYRHPSKYGTDVPRRCYLEELTPEERAIRDLVDTVERLGAHPLLTATVIQLMKAGEDLADWVDIGLRDKAIAALSPGNDLGLLDDGQLETSPVQSAIDQDKAPELWWYASGDEEFYNIGPCGTREGAIEAALADEVGISDDTKRQTIFVMQASQEPVKLSRMILVDDIVDRAMDGLFSDMAGTEGDPADLIDHIKDEQWKALEASLRLATDEWQAASKIIVTPTVFQYTTKAEYLCYLYVDEKHVPARTWEEAPFDGIMDAKHVADGDTYALINGEWFGPLPEGVHAPIEAAEITADAERTSDESQATDQDRVELKQTESSSQASSTEAVIPEGFTKWEGGDCPVEFDTTVEMILEGYSSPVTAKYATSYNWTGDWDTDDDVEPPTAVAPVRAYRIIKATPEAERTEVDSPPTEQDRVEQAAFAPLNEDEGLMWSNGFQTDAKSKAEPEQDKRPFWMFAKKEPA